MSAPSICFHIPTLESGSEGPSPTPSNHKKKKEKDKDQEIVKKKTRTRYLKENVANSTDSATYRKKTKSTNPRERQKEVFETKEIEL
jgi:hypothetical protein